MDAGAFQAHTFKVDETGNRLPYLLHLPEGHRDGGDERWPLVLFLHGASERGDDPAVLATQGLPKRVADGIPVPFVLLAPQCPAYSTWTLELSGVYALLEEVSARYGIDRDRTCVTGLSMGGTGSWAMATRYPDRFAAVAPICGSWLPEAAPRIDHLPVWTFHGADDLNIPVGHTDKVVDALKERGSPVRFTRYENVGHDSWTRTYADPELYTWLLAQRRGVAPAG
ncbi:PHB depolymerase family esterase [Streptomyces sp. NPDC052095]|uniref:carboxylesterase family protein n=1 Tax=unclassified Streptomyces TaxID=2593676 RepID=UPI00344F8252